MKNEERPTGVSHPSFKDVNWDKAVNDAFKEKKWRIKKNDYAIYCLYVYLNWRAKVSHNKIIFMIIKYYVNIIVLSDTNNHFLPMKTFVQKDLLYSSKL